jgi:hypothetical protein
MRGSITWIAVLLLGGALLAGCGGGGPSSSATTATSSSATTATGSSSTPTASTSTGASTATTAPTGTTGSTTTPTTPSGLAGASVTRAVEACKHVIQGQSSLSADTKSKLEALCAEGASGNTAELKAAARKACEEIVNRYPTLAGEAKTRALEDCKASTK